jgi:glycosyltransferase involved in cell wall biosynthesis
MKKIGLIINISIEETGVSTYVKSVLKSLQNNENIILLITNNSWNSFVINKYNFKIFNINNFFPLFYKCLILFKQKSFGLNFFKLFDPLGIYIRKSNIDLYIFPTPCYLTFFIDKPSIVAVHDLMHLTEKKFKESSSFLTSIYRGFIYQNIASNFSKIIFESIYGKKMFLEHYTINKKSKTYVLDYPCPNYVIEIMNNKSYLNYSTHKFGNYFFYPASFWPHKNHINLLYAFKKIITKGYNYNIVFSGGLNKNYFKLKKIVAKLGLEQNIFFTGYVQDFEIVALYVGSQALVMPTFFGPTNIPPIEAIFCRTPIITSDIYGIKNQLENSALYFDPNSLLDIERALLEFFETDREKLIQKGASIKEKFSLVSFEKGLVYAINEN